MCDACAELFATLAPPPPAVEHSPPDPPHLRESATPIPGLAEQVAPDEPDADFAPEPNELANKAFVTSLIGLLIPVVAVAGFLMGYVALLQIAGRPRAFANRGIAYSAVGIAAAAMLLHGFLIVTTLRYVKHAAYLAAHRKIYMAIQVFTTYAGVPPASLDDLTLPAGSRPDYLPPLGYYSGPYLRGTDGIASGPVPKNPYADGDTVEAHWSYNPDTEELTSAVGVPYGFAEPPALRTPERPVETIPLPH